MEDNIVERIVKAEQKIESLLEKTSRLEDSQLLLLEIKSFIQVQNYINKDNQEIYKETRDTLEKVNENLTNLNVSQVNLQNEIGLINQRIADVEEGYKQTEDNGKIDVVSLMKNIFVYVIMGIVAYGLARLGIKQ